MHKALSRVRAYLKISEKYEDCLAPLEDNKTLFAQQLDQFERLDTQSDSNNFTTIDRRIPLTDLLDFNFREFFNITLRHVSK